MGINISGSFPSPLYRAYDKERYARLFLERGSFMMRHLSFYRNIEDVKRKDKGEGEGRIDYVMEDRPKVWIGKESGQILSQGLEPGSVHFQTYSINPCYILCFSGPQVNMKWLSSRYQYIVRIHQPNMLTCDIASYLEQDRNMPDEMWVDCIKVRYDKDQLVQREPEPASKERLRMSYGQKEPRFSSECEYRLVLTLPLTTTSPPTEIKVELQKRLEYAEMLDYQPTTKLTSNLR